MFKIGEFAKVTGISIYMLRHYDKIGLLKPEEVDEESGYRYYSDKQIVFANTIQILKSLGFSLKEIMEVPDAHEDSQRISAFLEKKIKEKEAERLAIEEQLSKMKTALYEMKEQKEASSLSIILKEIPERKVIAYRGLIKRFDEEGLLWEKLYESCKKLGVKLAPVTYSFGITHHVDLNKAEIDVEVQLMVEVLGKDQMGVTFKKMPACLVAAIAYEGDYSQIGSIKKYMKDWIRENDYIEAGKSFSTYYRSPGNEQNMEKFITEVCFPINKK